MTCGVVLLCVSCLHVCVPFWKGRGREGLLLLLFWEMMSDDGILRFWWVSNYNTRTLLQSCQNGACIPNVCLLSLSLSVLWEGEYQLVSMKASNTPHCKITRNFIFVDSLYYCFSDVTCLAQSSDDTILASQSIICLNGPYYCFSDAVTCLALSSDGKILASGSNDKTARVWSMENGACSQVLTHAGNQVWWCVTRVLSDTWGPMHEPRQRP